MKLSKRTTNIGMLLLIIILLIWSFTAYTYSLNMNTKDMLINRVQESYSSNSDGALTSLGKMINDLKITADEISTYENFEDKAAINKIIAENLTDKNIIKTELVDINGKSIFDEKLEYKNNDFFAAGLTGNAYISTYYNSQKELCTALSVPIINNEKVMGVLRGHFNFVEINTLINQQNKNASRPAFLLLVNSLLIIAILSSHIIILFNKRTAVLRDKKNQLDTLTSNIPGGVQCCENDDDLTISYLSDGFLTLTGFTADEIEIDFSNKYINMIYPKDRPAVISAMKNNDGEVFELQYRLIRKDGTVIWILDKGQLISDNHGRKVYYCVLVDISDLKRAEKELVKNRRELEISNKRFQIIINQSGSIIFDYDLKSHKISFSGLFKKAFGYYPPTEDFPDCFISQSIIHPDDVSSFNNFYDSLIGGAHNFEAEYRLINAKGEFLWCSFQATTIFDDENVPVKAVGRIIDITKQKSETLSLIEKSHTDSLTGLLYKTTAKDLIESYLSVKNTTQSAMMIVDIDNFRSINEAFGYQFCDKVLFTISQRLSDLIGPADIISRIGDDVFLIFLKDCTADSIAEKASEICALVKNIEINNVYTNISVSIGIAISPKDAATHDELYKKANLALCFIKRSGKDNFIFFSEKQNKEEALFTPFK